VERNGRPICIRPWRKIQTASPKAAFVSSEGRWNCPVWADSQKSIGAAFNEGSENRSSNQNHDRFLKCCTIRGYLASKLAFRFVLIMSFLLWPYAHSILLKVTRSPERLLLAPRRNDTMRTKSQFSRGFGRIILDSCLVLNLFVNDSSPENESESPSPLRGSIASCLKSCRRRCDRSDALRIYIWWR
jgi:hypothetical protein